MPEGRLADGSIKHPEVALLLHLRLATIHEAVGDLPKSFAHVEDALAVIEVHSELAPSFGLEVSCAKVRALVLQGHFRESLKLAEELMAREQGNPVDWSLYSLTASAATKLGDHAKAESLQRQAIDAAINEESPNPMVAIGLTQNLANAILNQGRIEEAIKMHKANLNAATQALGEDSPTTAMIESNLAVAYTRSNQEAMAEPLFKHVLEIHRKILGNQHPDTLRSIRDLAVNQQNLDHLDLAAQLYEEFMDAEQNLFGFDHPKPLFTMHNYAQFLFQKQEYVKAFDLMQKVTEARKRVLGPEHPETLSSLVSLAGCKGMIGDREEAIEELTVLCVKMEDILGQNHRYSQGARMILKRLQEQVDPIPAESSPETFP
ncbi:MAG: tetratricopeptide repeat protein [Pirellulaceae bacterium]